MSWWSDIPLNTTNKVKVAKLSFDKENPRYSSDKGLPHDTDEEIVAFLNETSDLGELLQSISTSGYVDIEPLIVLGDQERLVVLEGNRRLAAISCSVDRSSAAIGSSESQKSADSHDYVVLSFCTSSAWTKRAKLPTHYLRFCRRA